MATLDITADTQAYDPLRQVITAQGNVRLQLNDAFLEADRIWVNLLNRYAVAEGNVLITRGAQIVRGERVEYNLTQASGVMFNARGEIFLPSIGTDIASPIDGPPTNRSPMLSAQAVSRPAPQQRLI
jgi:lipopolysaccharide assembly outer membrane protein LptD (OstA)